MNRSIGFLLGSLLVIGVFLFASTRDLSAQVPTVKGKGNLIEHVELIQNQLADLEDVSIYTVPASRRLVITDVLISNSNTDSVCCQRIYRSDVPATTFLSVPAESTFSHSFVTGLEFEAGEEVVVRNGASSGPTNWFLTGYLTKPVSAVPGE